MRDYRLIDSMKRILLLLVFLFLSFIHLFAQSSQTQAEQKRREKIELILRFQDLRTIHDGKLVSFLSDPDSTVRERAVRAFGSIQDTSVIPLLVNALSDKSSGVQYAAAFVIGTTVGQLSEKNRRNLEHALIWSHLDRTLAADQLIEEIGKFGSAEALHDLVLRFGKNSHREHSTAMMMSIGRFAIRGITSDDATDFLLRFVKPADAAPWQTVYALQRIGDHKQIRYELEHVVQLYTHHDPLVRMYCATLLGKIKDEKTSLEPLLKLAEFDGDWRVRVNAVKALGNFDVPGKDDLLQMFRRSFSDENVHVAVTALSTFGDLKINSRDSIVLMDEVVQLLRRMAKNMDNHYKWQIQGEAAIALAKLEGEAALPFIKPMRWYNRYLQYDLLTAIAYTRSREAEFILFDYFGNPDPMIQRAVLDGLQILSRKNSTDSTMIQRVYDLYLQALRGKDVSILSTAALILGDSLFLRPSSVRPLLETLTRLRLPDDVEAMQEIIATLGKLRDRQAVELLQQYLRGSDRSVALASASALRSITGQDYLSRLPKSFEPLLTDFDFEFLRSLSDTVLVTMETIRGDVVMELYKNAAPFTVMSFLKLAQRGFYRGLPFHRVVPNFVIQGGDPRGDGWGGPGYSLRSEFSTLQFAEGAVGIASAGKDTEGSQFFITHSPQPHLDGRYTLFGKVVSGMEVVNRIQIDDKIFDIKSVP